MQLLSCVATATGCRDPAPAGGCTHEAQAAGSQPKGERGWFQIEEGARQRRNPGPSRAYYSSKLRSIHAVFS